MSLPQRNPETAPEARPRPNIIELNTITGMPRRKPYVFKAEPAVPAAQPKPYVFPEELPDPDVSARSKVRLFDFLSSGKPVIERKNPSDEDAWTRLTRDFDHEDDPDAVSTMLADLLAKLDDVAQRRLEHQLRIVPAGAGLLPPLGVATTLLSLHAGLPALARAFELTPLASWAPWIAAALAVPLGLLVANAALGRLIRPVQPGEGLRVGEQKARVLATGLGGWLVEFEDQTQRRLPYYVAVYAGTERRPDPEDGF